MDHIALMRLMQLRAEAIVSDPLEAEHLRHCPECRALLRKLAEDRSRALAQKASPPEDGSYSKSA
jgi:hypothetical protein